MRALPQPQERLLHELLGQPAVAQQAQPEAVQAPFVAVIERAHVAPDEEVALLVVERRRAFQRFQHCNDVRTPC